MNEFKSCLVWGIAIVSWFILWGLCLFIEEITGVSCFHVLLFVLGGLIVLAILGLAVYGFVDRIRLSKEIKKEGEIKQVYPHGYEAWRKKMNPKTISDIISAVPEIKQLENLFEQASSIKSKFPVGYKRWITKHCYFFINDATIVSAETDIMKLDQFGMKADSFDKWEKKQAEFANRCRTLRDKYLPKFGCYSYDIGLEKVDEYGNCIGGKYIVWQLFRQGFCLDDSLDYTHFANMQNLKMNSGITESCEQLNLCMAAIADEFCTKEQPLTIYVNANMKTLNESTSAAIALDIEGDCINNNKIIFIDPIIDKVFGISVDTSYTIKGKHIVVIDFVTSNNDLKSFCKKIISENSSEAPLITYISLMKEYDSDEMQKLIDDKNKELKAEDEERREKESLMSKVSDWDNQIFKLRYKYLLKYYPTTCKFEANEDELADRRTVWNFKNEPGVISPEAHRQALNEIIPRIKEILINTFGNSSLKYLTFVCVPASSQEKTEARYKEFSARLCGETNMENAYDHIKVINNRISKHKGGGRFKNGDLQFDEDFFKDKYVLLFDDVITSGVTICKLKMEMEQLGAKVVCGLSIGKTKRRRDT